MITNFFLAFFITFLYFITCSSFCDYFLQSILHHLHNFVKSYISRIWNFWQIKILSSWQLLFEGLMQISTESISNPIEHSVNILLQKILYFYLFTLIIFVLPSFLVTPVNIRSSVDCRSNEKRVNEKIQHSQLVKSRLFDVQITVSSTSNATGLHFGDLMTSTNNSMPSVICGLWTFLIVNMQFNNLSALFH